MKYENHSIRLNDTETLNLSRFYCKPLGAPVFMLHGVIENGRIFYSRNGKGLAPYLASRGFDVYVADLRGKGESKPSIGKSSAFGQTEVITTDIPAFTGHIKALRGNIPQYWIAHSWGGVLLSSYLARFPLECGTVRALVYFGAKRSVRVRNIHSLLKVDLVWQRLCPLIARWKGYLPARQMRFGSDNESLKFLLQCNEWVKDAPWVDPEDFFDYGDSIRKIDHPPVWYLGAQNDHSLGHPDDVRDFMVESGVTSSKYSVLSKQNGNLHNYDHINMLTHPDAAQDHFPLVVEWLESH